MSDGSKEYIYKAAGIVVRDRALLVERSKGKEFFIAPGGSIEPGETPEAAVIRELFEEFKIVVKENDLSKFGEFEAPAAGQEHRMVHMTVFTITAWEGEPEADNEVEEIAYVTSDNPDKLRLGSIIEHEIIPRLVAQNIID